MQSSSVLRQPRAGAVPTQRGAVSCPLLRGVPLPRLAARRAPGPVQRHLPAKTVVAALGDAVAPKPAANGAKAPPVPRSTPSDEVLSIWRRVDAVCFDVDCTLTVNDSLDLLAAFMGVAEEVEELTHKAMDGTLDLTQALEQRLNILNCTPADIKRFIAAHPPESRLVPNIAKFIKALQARGIAVYFISGGFRELILPIAKYLGVPRENVFANRMNWQWDDETGMPSKLVGFDLSEPTAHNLGKPQAIAQIRQKNPYNTVVMIGDGITDLEAVQTSNGADLFIGYGGVVSRPAVVEAAEWFVTDYQQLLDAMKRYKVAMVGSGAWACAAMHMIAANTFADDPADEFVDEVNMWVYEEEFNGQKLTELINTLHENPKYLPGVKLGDGNVKAIPNLADAVKDADVLVFCAPHQFLHGICKQLVGKVKKDAIAISLIKGMRVRPEGPQLISEMIRRYLGIDCSVLMGANIATDIGKEELSEAVIGYNYAKNAEVFRKLFDTPYFSVSVLPDVIGAEMCGTLKNIVAMGAGIVDGLGLGPNTKATVIRQGLIEMRKFSKALFPTVRDETFLEACGVADLVATCYGGRNRYVAEAWTKALLSGKPRTFDDLEAELLKGQKLQGVLTSNEVQEILQRRGWEKEYPLFTTINRILNGHLAPEFVVKYREGCKVPVTPVRSEEEVEGEVVSPRKSPKKLAVA